MGHTEGSINEHLMGLDIEDSERDQVKQESEYAKLYRQAREDAAFLRNLSMKEESATEKVYPFSVPFRSRSVGHQEYAFYRQKYLVTYSPFRTFGKNGDKKSMKEKINKWFTLKKKENYNPETKTIEPKSTYKSSYAGFLDSVLRFLRFLHRKSSSVSPVS